MRQKIFAICDTEEAYALRLSEYMLEKIRLPYALHLFTRVEELQKFVQEEKVEILLIAENALKMLQEESIRQQVVKMFVLQEEGAVRQREGAVGQNVVSRQKEDADRQNAMDRQKKDVRADSGYVSKFQSPEKIIAWLYEAIADISDWRQEVNVQDTGAKLIGIYSPIKRCLQTSFALTMGQILAKEHKTLYFNFENYSGFSQMLQKEFSMDMTDLMYYFRCAKDKLFLRLPSVIQNMNGLDYVPPTRYRAKKEEITGTQWLELCRNIAAVGHYEYIILDLDDSMEGLFDLLQNCNKIYTITKDDRFAAAKMNQYEQILKFYELEEIADKTVKCKFPVFKELPADMDLMTHGEMAGYVRAIVRKDLYGE